MAKVLKEQKFVRLFLLIFNGETPRLDEQMQGLLKVFVEMFGPSFASNACLVFTRWKHTNEARKSREREGRSEAERTRAFNEEFKKMFNYQGESLPCFFIDSLYDPV